MVIAGQRWSGTTPRVWLGARDTRNAFGWEHVIHTRNAFVWELVIHTRNAFGWEHVIHTRNTPIMPFGGETDRLC